MAAACDTEALQDASVEAPALTDTEIVAQAITELQQICPGTNQLSEEAACSSVITVGEAGTSTESQSFLNYLRNDNSGLDTGDVQVNDDLLNEGTQVIYYIEDGVVARSEKVLIDTSVQANDYEIERRSGRLPARKRVIPYKFRDFKNTSNDEDSDSDYEPDVKPRVKRSHKEKTEVVDQHEKILGVTVHKRPGRPRKHPLQTNININASSITSGSQTGNDAASHFQKEARGESQREAVGQSQKEASQSENEAEEHDLQEPKEINVTVIKLEDDSGVVTDRRNSNEMDDGDDAGDDVVIVRKGRGRPRGSDWRREYECPTCQKCFAQKGNLKTHLRTHTNERPFPCTEENCGKFFRSQESLRRHILSHRGIKPFECDICHNKFSSNVGLQEHRSRHTDSRPHKCPHCPRHFRQVSCLRRHILTHSSEKPYCCSVCAARFAQIAYLKSHMKVHTGEKRYVCDICQKRFAHQSDVKRHKITHTGEKRYSCEICQAKFSDPSSKRRHEKEHSKKKAYICQLCDETFRRSGQLKAHLTSKHMLAVQIETDNATGKSSLLFETTETVADPMPANQRIAQLIRSLSTKTSLPSFDTVEVETPSVNHQSVNQSQAVAMTSGHVTEIGQLQHVGETELIETTGEHPVEFQSIEIQEEEVGGQTYIAITDLAESLLPSKVSTDENSVTHYQIIQQVTEEGDTHQVLVPLNETDGAEINAVIQETVGGIDQGDMQVELVHGSNDHEHGGNDHEHGSNDHEQEHNVHDQEQNLHAHAVQEHSVHVQERDSQIENQPLAQVHHGQVHDSEVITNQEPMTDVSLVNNNNRDISDDSRAGFSATDTNKEISEVENANTTVAGEENAETIKAIAAVEQEKVDQDPTEAETSQDKTFVFDYVTNPDFSSQDYFNWLSNFTELCKVVPMPLDVSLFQKISQVHKTVSDVMATPSGVVADKENFRVLMNITKELSAIINEHLVYILENLNPDSKSKDNP